MDIETKVSAICKIELDDIEAFRLLCRTLYMDYLLDENRCYKVYDGEYGGKFVYEYRDGQDVKIDDRGELFVALRNVAVQIFPNVRYRNEEYIYD